MRLRIAMALSAVALVAACGTATTEDPGAGGTSPGSASGTSSGGTSATAAFPLTVTRTGGIAGFNDTIVVQSDGSAEVTGKTKSAPAKCTVAAADLADLSSQVLAVVNAPAPSEPQATPDHVVADAINITMTAGTSKPVKLSDPGAVVPKAVSALVSDVTGNPPAHKICSVS